MKKRFTRILFVAAIGLCSLVNVSAQEFFGGIGWGNIGLGDNEPLIINENFQNWTRTHSVSKAEFEASGGGVSKNAYFDSQVQVPIYNWSTDTGNKFTIKMIQCAVAPDVRTQYWYMLQITGDASKYGVYSHDLVSPGFVEMAKMSDTQAATTNGYFIIPKIDYIEGLQYSFASNGGSKRGFLLEISTDEGETWSIVRDETGNLTTSTSGTALNESGYGQRFEEYIDTENAMLRFSITKAGVAQTVRLHDLKIYGTLNPSSIGSASADAFNIGNTKDVVYSSVDANIAIYSIAGNLLQTKSNVTEVSIQGLPTGMYIVKATSLDGAVVTKKIVK